jgi:hypothetical protein
MLSGAKGSISIVPPRTISGLAQRVVLVGQNLYRIAVHLIPTVATKLPAITIEKNRADFAKCSNAQTSVRSILSS